jgi:hypothetical protein
MSRSLRRHELWSALGSDTGIQKRCARKKRTWDEPLLAAIKKCLISTVFLGGGATKHAAASCI